MILCLSDPTDFAHGALGSDHFSKESEHKVNR